MTEEPEVITRKTGQVGRITLNRPKALNALTHGMCLTMIEALEDQLQADPIAGTSGRHDPIARKSGTAKAHASAAMAATQATRELAPRDAQQIAPAMTLLSADLEDILGEPEVNR